MELPEVVRAEWRERHCLLRPSTLWLEEHADAGDLHPVVSAIAQLRAEDQAGDSSILMK